MLVHLNFNLLKIPDCHIGCFYFILFWCHLNATQVGVYSHLQRLCFAEISGKKIKVLENDRIYQDLFLKTWTIAPRLEPFSWCVLLPTRHSLLARLCLRTRIPQRAPHNLEAVVHAVALDHMVWFQLGTFASSIHLLNTFPVSVP